jgi:hypothetical protein
MTMIIAIVRKLLSLDLYILGERTVVLQEGGDFEKIKISFSNKKIRNYSTIVEDARITIKKSGLLPSPSHYAAITKAQGNIEYEIKMNRAERIFAIAFVSAITLAALAASIALAINLVLYGYADETVLVAAAVIIVSISLLVLLKIICLFLVFLSGIGNPAKLLKKLDISLGQA